MAARITRAKKKIAGARIPYRVPPVSELRERVSAVLAVVHLLYTTGHTAPAGTDLVRPDLVERALDLTRMLRALLPDDPDVAGLLALILLTDARRSTRTPTTAGCCCSRAGSQPLGRRRDPRGHHAGAPGVAPPAPGPLRAAGRYRRRPRRGAVLGRDRLAGDRRAVRRPAAGVAVPVVALNRAVAVGMADGPAAGLRASTHCATSPALAAYGYAAAARADFLRRLGDVPAARLAYEEALHLTVNEVERAFLLSRLQTLPPTGSTSST
jgi:RNA polymerase sigma-70 factor (ECF subfamily)